MKKFLSLVLAMIMTMSLVTISAGATEYKDLTDKDEIKYEEAVAVLNRIGVITGYPDGSFQPETELTRGAAAKIIVSLMIGPDAAAALPNTSSPYPDVPAGHTFAGVISYCKTKNYISGYGDGTFKPAGTLTGYAFAKMLLGALGYSSDIERFTGSGWTMNVANVGNVAGLFDRISFDGAAAVTRDEACQLALNTLKATIVTYGGTSVVNGSTGSYTIQNTQATPKTSNNRDINANIGRKDWYGGNNKGSDYLTLEFGEEHFKDLRLEHDRFDPAHDDFGRPSNEWSYKKVTIGTFPLEAEYTFTTQVAHIEDTDGTKEKALGLRNFDLVSDGGYSTWNGWGNDGRGGSTYGGTTTLWLNGLEDEDYFSATKDGKLVRKVANIADFTDNGTLVEVYVSNVDADWITDVVVIQTQLMEVKKVGSDYVSLEKKEPDAFKNNSPRGTANTGFNLAPIEVTIEQVKDSNEDCYSILKDLKSGDEVAVIPVTTDNGKTYEAAEVYVPETVSGALTRVDTYGTGRDDAKKRGAIEITVGGTSYKIADWNDEMWALKTEDIKATRKDVTLLMDKYGNALLAKDVGATNDFMVIGNYYQSLVGNKVCTFVHGWDISGNEIDLNLGSNVKVTNHGGSASVYGHVLGELVYYTSDGASGDADYILDHGSKDGKKTVNAVFTSLEKTGTNVRAADGKADYEIKASNLLVPLVDATGNAYWTGNDDTTAGNGKTTHSTTAVNDTAYTDRYYDKGVKFIYVNYVAGEDEIDSVEFKSGVQNVSQDELRGAIQWWGSQAAVKDEQVKAVVIKRESADASINRMLYVTKTLGFKEYDKDSNESFYRVEVAMFTDGKFETEREIIVNKDLQIGDFATYTKVAGTKYEDDYYRVKTFTRHNANPAVLRTDGVSKVLSSTDGKMVKHLLQLSATKTTTVNNVALIADIGDDGVNAVLNKESYVLGGYRGSATTVPNTVGSAQGVIRADKAEWLNATRDSKWDDIDSVEDLFDETDGNVKLDILLNEKPDSDGFRTAYLIVLKEVNGTSGGSDSSTVKGSSWTATTKINSNGYILYTINVARPDWVPADASVEFSSFAGELLVDGVKVATFTESSDFVYDKKSATLSYWTTSPFADEDSDVTIRVTDIEWEKVKVETKGDTNLVSVAPATEVATDAIASLTFTVKSDCGNGKATLSQNGKVLDTVGVVAGTSSYTITSGTTKIDTTAPVVVTFELAASTVEVERVHTTTIESAPSVEKKTSETPANAYLDSIKELDRGVYEAPAIDQDDLTTGNPMYRGGNDVADEDCIVIVFPKSGKAETYTLQIDGSDSVYKETIGPAAAGNLTNAFFHVQINNNHSTYFANEGSGDMATTPLAAGDHTYTITGSLSGVVQDGKFHIQKEGLNEVVTPGTPSFTMPTVGEDGTTPATQDEKDKACKDLIRSLSDGVYNTPDFTGTSIGMLQSSNYANTKFWKVATDNGGEDITIELYLAGTKVYNETVSTTSTATTVFFLIDVANGSNSTGQSVNWTTGNLVYKVIGSESGTMLEGTLSR